MERVTHISAPGLSDISLTDTNNEVRGKQGDFSLLLKQSLDELNEREIYYIALFNSTNSELGYNIKKGGEGGFPEVYAGEKNGMYGVHRFGEDNPNYGNH